MCPANQGPADLHTALAMDWFGLTIFPLFFAWPLSSVWVQAAVPDFLAHGLGEQVTITRRGVAVARLVPATTARRSTVSQSQRVSETFAQLRAQRAGVVLDAPLATVIAEGRD